MTLVVFDFDWSLINENSDTWIVQQFAPELAKQIQSLRVLPHFSVWTHLMDEMMRRLHVQGMTREQLEATFANIPFEKEALLLLQLIEKTKTESIIISDANSVFIDSILKSRGHAALFPPEKVFTNPAEWEPDGRLKVRTFHPLDKPHGCQLCPLNMCKGSILRSWMKTHECKTIAYVGDGAGDFCPTTSLRATDFVFARTDFKLAELCRTRPDSVKAQVFQWRDYSELFKLFHDHIFSHVQG